MHIAKTEVNKIKKLTLILLKIVPLNKNKIRGSLSQIEFGEIIGQRISKNMNVTNGYIGRIASLRDLIFPVLYL